MERPFLCKCGNWHIKVPVFDEQTKEPMICIQCAEGTHTPHIKTGAIDCHFGFQSATLSERQMGESVLRATNALTVAKEGLAAVAKANDQAATQDILTKAELVMAGATLAQAKVAEALHWAGVMEMPGTAGEPNSKRYKNEEALSLMVMENRRPPEDLATLRRSIRVCNEMAAEVTSLYGEASRAMQTLRESVASKRFGPPVVPVYAEAPVEAAKKPRTPAQIAAAERWRKARDEKRRQVREEKMKQKELAGAAA